MIETRTTLAFQNKLFNSASGHYDPESYLMNQIDEGQSEGQPEMNPAGLTGMNNLAADAPINMNTNSGPFDKTLRHRLRNDGFTPTQTGLGKPTPIGDARYYVNRKQSELYNRDDDHTSFRNAILGEEEEKYLMNM